MSLEDQMSFYDGCLEEVSANEQQDESYADQDTTHQASSSSSSFHKPGRLKLAVIPTAWGHLKPKDHTFLTKAIQDVFDSTRKPLEQSDDTPTCSMSIALLRDSLPSDALYLLRSTQHTLSLVRWLRNTSLHQNTFEVSSDGTRVSLAGMLSQQERSSIRFVPRAPGESWRTRLLQEADTWEVELDLDAEPDASEYAVEGEEPDGDRSSSSSSSSSSIEQDLLLSTLVATHQIPMAPTVEDSHQEQATRKKRNKTQAQQQTTGVETMTTGVETMVPAATEPLATALAQSVPTFAIPATLLRLSPDASRLLWPHTTLLAAAKAFPNILDV